MAEAFNDCQVVGKFGYLVVHAIEWLINDAAVNHLCGKFDWVHAATLVSWLGLLGKTKHSFANDVAHHV